MSEFDEFYSAFEEQYRGSYAEIKERLTAYLPIVQETVNSSRSQRVLDLGTGRGEWLELMADHGIEAIGLDQNSHSSKLAKARRLNVKVGDVSHLLDAEPSDSYSVITAFHLIEHLDLTAQFKFFQDTFRLLEPGGALIIEWPNIENMWVAQYSFWYDPSHIRPLPRETICFMAKYAGFSEINIRRFRPYSLHQESRKRNKPWTERMGSWLYATFLAKLSFFKQLSAVVHLFTRETDIALVAHKLNR